MAKAFECDVCGELYKQIPKGSNIKLLDATSKNGGDKHFHLGYSISCTNRELDKNIGNSKSVDACPVCLHEIITSFLVRLEISK